MTSTRGRHQHGSPNDHWSDELMGVGNVAGLLAYGIQPRNLARHLLLQGGIVRLPPLRTFTISVNAGDTYLRHDGIRKAFIEISLWKISKRFRPITMVRRHTMMPLFWSRASKECTPSGMILKPSD
jgi:hypothetical protein